MIEKISNNDLSSMKEGADVAIIFSATWCQSCHELLDHIEPLSALFQGKLFNADVDDNEELAEKYNIKTLPCTLILNGGTIKDRFENNTKFSELMERLTKL